MVTRLCPHNLTEKRFYRLNKLKTPPILAGFLVSKRRIVHEIHEIHEIKTSLL